MTNRTSSLKSCLCNSTNVVGPRVELVSIAMLLHKVLRPAPILSRSNNLFHGTVLLGRHGSLHFCGIEGARNLLIVVVLQLVLLQLGVQQPGHSVNLLGPVGQVSLG